MSNTPNRPWLRLVVLLAPLTATPALAWSIAEGWLNFGGGEKDLVWLIPWLSWSLTLLLIGLIGWQRWQGLGPWSRRTFGWSLGLTLVAWLALATWVGIQ